MSAVFLVGWQVSTGRIVNGSHERGRWRTKRYEGETTTECFRAFRDCSEFPGGPYYTASLVAIDGVVVELGGNCDGEIPLAWADEFGLNVY